MSLFLRNSRLLSIVGLVALLCIQSTNSFAGVSYDECFNGLVSDDVSYYTTGIRELSDDVAPYTPQKLVADNVLTSSGSTNCAPAKNAHIEEYIDGMDWEVVYNNGLTVKGYAACGGSKYNAANSPYTWSGTSGTTKIASTYTSCLCSLDANVLEGDDKDNAKWYFAVKPADNSAYTSDYVGKLRNCREVCPQKCAEAFINGTGAVRNALSDINSCDVFQSGNSGGGTTNCGDTQYLDGDTCVDKDDAWCASDPNYGSTYYWDNSSSSCQPKNDAYCHKSISDSYYWIDGDCVENYERYCNDVWFDEGYYWNGEDCVEKDNAYCIATNDNKPYYYLDGNVCKINRTMYCQIESGDGYSWNESSGSCQLNLPNCDEATQYLDANNQCVAKDTAWCENNSNYGPTYYWNNSSYSCQPKNDAWCASNSNYGSGFYWNGSTCTEKNTAWCQNNYGADYEWVNNTCSAWCENNNAYYLDGGVCTEKNTAWCESNSNYGLSYYWHDNQCTLKNYEYCQEINTAYYWNGNGCEVKNTDWCENNVGSSYYWHNNQCTLKNDEYCQEINTTYYWNGSSCDIKNTAWCENNVSVYYYSNNGNCEPKNDEWCGNGRYYNQNANECFDKNSDSYCEYTINEYYYWDGNGCSEKNNDYCHLRYNDYYYLSGSVCVRDDNAYCRGENGADYYYWDNGGCVRDDNAYCRSVNSSNYFQWKNDECVRNNVDYCHGEFGYNYAWNGNECVETTVLSNCADGVVSAEYVNAYWPATPLTDYTTFETLLGDEIITQTNSGSSIEYKLMSVDTLADYIDGEEWSVVIDNVEVKGMSICGPNSWSKDLTRGTKKTVSTSNNGFSAYRGCACALQASPDSLAATEWYVVGKSPSSVMPNSLLISSNGTWPEKSNDCRAKCPVQCAYLAATDADFRNALFGGSCPAGIAVGSITCGAGEYLPGNGTSCEPCASGSYCNNYSVTYDMSLSDQGATSCSGATNGVYPNSDGGYESTNVSKCYAVAKFYSNYELIDEFVSNYSYDIIESDTGYDITNVPQPDNMPENHAFIGWCEGSTYCDENTVVTDFTNLRGNKNYFAIYAEYIGVCNPGYYLPQQSTSCESCPAGSYCPDDVPFYAASNEDRGIESCSDATNGIYPNSDGEATSISDCYATVSFFDGIVHGEIVVSYDADALNDGYDINDSMSTPLTPDGYDFVGWCEGSDDCDEDSVITDFSGLRGNKEYNAIFKEHVDETYTCEPGFYLPRYSQSCEPCEENSYCPGDGEYYYSEERNQGIESCPNGLVSPAGTASSADHCGKMLRIGDMVLYLTREQQTHPALAVRLNDVTYYAKATAVSNGAKSKLRTKIDGIEYSIHDNISQEE